MPADDVAARASAAGRSANDASIEPERYGCLHLAGGIRLSGIPELCDRRLAGWPFSGYPLVDVESLSAPLSDALPCGESLEYDPAFADLEQTARGKPEQHFGATLIPAQDPDWRAVGEKALALFDRTRDLRVAVLLARSQTALHGPAGLADGIALIERLVDRHWEHVHPQLDPEDDLDPTIRVNALAALVDPVGLQRELRNSILVASPAGSCTVRDAEAVLGAARLPDGQEPPISRPQLQGLMRAHAASGGSNAAQQAFDALRTLEASLGARVGSSQTIDLTPLSRRLRLLAASYAEATGEPAGAAADGETAAAAGSDAGAAAPGAAPARGGAGGGRNAVTVGEIRSREDAVRELDRISSWIERNEPSNPAPLLIRRAQRLVQMNFLDIIRDVAPEGLASIEKIAGLPPAES
ncbi:MAG: type VI secretion system protein TssA [Lautropia sp.]